MLLAMESYEPSTWGDRLADVYDEMLGSMALETEPAVELLAELAGGGPVLELAIGTGRIGLPLSERGLEVHGIEASPAMVEKLRARPGGDRIPVTIGDFAEVGVEGSYPLIFVVANTLFLLHSEEDQLRCYHNVAAHLTDDGIFVVEAHVPNPARYRDGQAIDIFSLEPDRVMLGFSRRDAATQRVESVEVWITEKGIRLFPSRDRPVPPAELDVMARRAGLELRDRWSDWQRSPFTAASERHISVYAKQA